MIQKLIEVLILSIGLVCIVLAGYVVMQAPIPYPAGPGRMYEKHHTTQFEDCVLRVGSIAAERGLTDEQAFLLLGKCASDRGLML